MPLPHLPSCFQRIPGARSAPVALLSPRRGTHTPSSPRQNPRASCSPSRRTCRAEGAVPRAITLGALPPPPAPWPPPHLAWLRVGGSKNLPAALCGKPGALGAMEHIGCSAAPRLASLTVIPCSALPSRPPGRQEMHLAAPGLAQLGAPAAPTALRPTPRPLREASETFTSAPPPLRPYLAGGGDPVPGARPGPGPPSHPGTVASRIPTPRRRQ